MKFLFRISGGATNQHELGTWHIFRCMNITKALKNNTVFVVEDYDGIKKIKK